MTQPKPQKKALLEQLREILGLTPNISDEEVIKQASETQLNLKQFAIDKQEKFKVVFEAFRREVGQENKETAIEGMQYSWMTRKEEQKHTLQAVFAYVLAVEKRNDKEEAEAQAFDALTPDEEERYQEIEKPHLETLAPSLPYKYNTILDVIREYELDKLGVVAQVVQRDDGVKSICINGVTAENFEAVRNAFQANYSLEPPRPREVPNKKQGEESGQIFNPTPLRTRPKSPTDTD